ncbi:MAG: glycogen debranching protein GlgX [Propionibacteriaceae bacterium]|jgi:glycogen operon protein|nr:glycogen debranching protein GlgX [Propionibacteriaceae bacterium]
MSQPELPSPDANARLGVTLDDTGALFSLWAPRATRVELALVTRQRQQSNRDMTLGDGGVWTVYVPGVKPEQMYGFRVHGLWDPQSGQRFNAARLLLDPYAKAMTGGVDYSGPIHDHISESDYLPDTTDSAKAVPLSVVVAPSAPPIPLEQAIRAQDRVILETHVKGYTLRHPLVPEHLRGKFGGLAYPAVIQHLKSIGVTTIELLPVHHFVSEPFIIRAGLCNYWGYNTMGFFAPHAAYGSVGTMGEQVEEFKDMVSALHQAGIEVILDVVYNHTGEGNHEGPTLGFRGIDHAGYYRLNDNMYDDYDVTGCGNSLDTSQPGVLRLVMDSLRYWAEDMGVDGFRFDLATTLIRDDQQHVDQNHPFKKALAEDPVLSTKTIIAEPWDVGPYGYQLGNWGPGWGEWNGKFRDYMRDFWRGQTAGVSELATRLSGSPDLFEDDGRQVNASINFVTAHDGFTLRDLVSYNGKHNEANNENNRDGNNDNRSWNCGVEGETDDPAIVALRQRQVRNFLMTMVLAHGTPMITAGDEFGRSQQGNNNAYCQDSPISWASWAVEDTWDEMTNFLGNVTSVRAAHPVLSPTGFMHHESVVDADGSPLDRPALAWLNGTTGEMGDQDWHDNGRRLLGMYSASQSETFILWLYAGADPIDITLPGPSWGDEYRILLHSGEEDEFPVAGETLTAGSTLTIPGRTTVLMQAVVSAQSLSKQSSVVSN